MAAAMPPPPPPPPPAMALPTNFEAPPPPPVFDKEGNTQGMSNLTVPDLGMSTASMPPPPPPPLTGTYNFETQPISPPNDGLSTPTENIPSEVLPEAAMAPPSPPPPPPPPPPMAMQAEGAASVPPPPPAGDAASAAPADVEPVAADEPVLAEESAPPTAPMSGALSEGSRDVATLGTSESFNEDNVITHLDVSDLDPMDTSAKLFKVSATLFNDVKAEKLSESYADKTVVTDSEIFVLVTDAQTYAYAGKNASIRDIKLLVHYTDRVFDKVGVPRSTKAKVYLPKSSISDFTANF